jgi:pimeloyl-ACP methyl ester carboxylesterase
MTTLVLVHGAFHGPSCFDPIIGLLDARGITTRAPELPLTSLADDVAAVSAALDAVEGPVALLGHSYGGAVISESGNHPSVDRLIFLAAMAPDDGEGIADVDVEIGPELIAAFRPRDDGLIEVDPLLAAAIFYPDADAESARLAVTRLRPGVVGRGDERIGSTAWRSHRTDYIVCAADPILLPSSQRALAARIGAQVHELAGDHSPFLARPEELVTLLADLLG